MNSATQFFLDGTLTCEPRSSAVPASGTVFAKQIGSLAEELPDARGMRAADAAQLAAALVWCRERPKQRPLVCFDERLRTAAAALGFSVRP